MAATTLGATTRFIEPGTTQYYWVPTITATTHIPTRAELDAGTDLTAEINSVDGFTVTSNSVDAPDFGKRFTPKVDGLITADDSSMTFYRSSDSDDVRSVLTRDLKGYIVMFPEGDDGSDSSITGTMDIFPVSVSAASKQHSNSDPAMIQIQFTITDEPVVDQDVPAAT